MLARVITPRHLRNVSKSLVKRGKTTPLSDLGRKLSDPTVNKQSRGKRLGSCRFYTRTRNKLRRASCLSPVGVKSHARHFYTSGLRENAKVSESPARNRVRVNAKVAPAREG